VTGHRILALDVVCPVCGAKPQEFCHRLGDSLTSHHARTLRAEREEAVRAAETATEQLPLFPRTQAGPVVFVCRRGRR
jgi:hypothetical protein